MSLRALPPLHSVTLCRCYAHLFFALPLLSYSLSRFTSAVRCHASPLQSLLGGSTQCRCSASPSIRYHAVAGRRLSQLRFAVASQCNALRALPLHNSSLPLLLSANLRNDKPLPFISYHSRCRVVLLASTPLLLGTVPLSASALLVSAPPLLCDHCGSMPHPSNTIPCVSLASPLHPMPRPCS